MQKKMYTEKPILDYIKTLREKEYCLLSKYLKLL
jgi:hypothetical protein